MKLYQTVTCPEQDTQLIYHIPDDPGADTTLCGLSDVPHSLHDADNQPSDCKECLEVIDWCRKIRFSR